MLPRCGEEIFFINLIIYHPSSFREGFPDTLLHAVILDAPRLPV